MMQARRMDSLQSLMSDLNIHDIQLWEENGKLHYRASQDVLTQETLAILKENKSKILEALRRNKEVPHSPAAAEESEFAPFRLTDSQSAYLLGRSTLFEYGGVACHVYLEVEYEQLDIPRAEKVVNRLIARHPMLRAIILKKGLQQVLEHVPYFKLTYQDLSLQPETAANHALDTIRQNMGYRYYDTEKWPLFDIKITRFSRHDILHLSMDLLIADWASINLMLNEFNLLYAQPQLILPPLEFTFQKYLYLEDQSRKTQQYQAAKRYWLERIDTLPSAPQLPMKRNNQEQCLAVRFRRYSTWVSPADWSSLKAKAQKYNLTPTAAVMSAFTAVIERWSTNKRFCLNLTLLNRLPMHEDVERIVGDFTSINLLSVDWKKENRFWENARAVQRQLFEDLDHRLFSGVEVIRELFRRHGTDASLMPIVFTSAIGLQPKGDSLERAFGGYGISQSPQVFIDCQVADSMNGLIINWDVRENIFPEQLISDMFECFGNVLAALAGEESAWTKGEAAVLPSWQWERMEKANSTQAPLPTQLLHEKVLSQIQKNQDKTAIILDGQITSYGELGKKAAAIAQALTDQGCQEQEKVAVIMPKGSDQIAATLAVLSIGAVFVPVDTKQPTARVLIMLAQADVRYILTLSQVQMPLSDYGTMIEVDTLAAYSGEIPCRRVPMDSLAYIIYTSGSTGQPKGAMLSHLAACNTIEDISRRFSINHEDVILGLSEPSFDLSIFDVFGVLSAGGIIVYPDRTQQTNPSHWYDLNRKYQVTVWNTVPALMQMFLEHLHDEQNVAIPSLRLVLLSGDWVPLDMPRQIQSYAQQVSTVALGGATEAAIWSNYHICSENEVDWVSIPYGYPLANQNFRILDAQGKDCPVWVKGELYIGGAGLAKGYTGDDRATEERFVQLMDGGGIYYKTGDWGRYLPNGEIEFLGREDAQVKIRGHRIELGEIEGILARHPAVIRACAVTKGKGSDRYLACAVQTGSKGAETDSGDIAVSEQELKKYLSAKLPAYMIPAKLLTISELPLSANGKVNRQDVEKWDFAHHDPQAAAEQADSFHDPLELEIMELCAGIIGVPQITRTGDFYDMGADSLIMARIANKLKESQAAKGIVLSYDMLLKQLLNQPTIANLAAFIRQNSGNRPAAEDNAATVQAAKNNGELTFFSTDQEGPLRVLFHAGLGTMNFLRYVIRAMKPQSLGPVVGITVKDPDVYCRLDPSTAVEQLADDYAERIMQLNNPNVQIIAVCVGGLIAVETARRLRENNINIVNFTLIDSIPVTVDFDDDIIMESMFVPNFFVNFEEIFATVKQADIDRAIQKILQENRGSIPRGSSQTIGKDDGLDAVQELFQRLHAMPMQERFRYYAQKIEEIGGSAVPAEMAESLYKVFRHSLRCAKYIPAPYFGDIHYLVAKESDQSSVDFWRKICLSTFTVEEIEGNHMNCVEDEVHAQSVAEILKEQLLYHR